MFRRRAHSERRWGRRLIGLAVLVSLCASFFPLPMGTTSAPSKDRSAPFPCQDRPCGCGSAEQCWKQCCCFTNAEKLVWAKANGVTPPEFVVAAAKAESTAKVVQAKASSQQPCPHSTKGSNACCQPASRAACCSTSGCGQGEVQPKTESASTRFVIGFEMLKCRGQGLFWNSLPWAVIPVLDVPEFRVDTGNWDRPTSVIADAFAAEPPEPPPRQV